jgi:hypothetical protein
MKKILLKIRLKIAALRQWYLKKYRKKRFDSGNNYPFM